MFMLLLSNLWQLVSARWQRGELLGRGAFGKVYLGLNQRSGELMAVKQVEIMDVPAADVAALEHEVQVLQRLSHRNIVRCVLWNSVVMLVFARTRGICKFMLTLSVSCLRLPF
jgi:hypothetical protein